MKVYEMYVTPLFHCSLKRKVMEKNVSLNLQQMFLSAGQKRPFVSTRCVTAEWTNDGVTEQIQAETCGQ